MNEIMAEEYIWLKQAIFIIFCDFYVLFINNVLEDYERIEPMRSDVTNAGAHIISRGSIFHWLAQEEMLLAA